MSYPLSIQRENNLLRRELGVEHGHARYQWRWGGDLEMPMIVYGDDGNLEYDYHCDCGINIRVHSADCGLTLPKARWEVRKVVPALCKQWVLTRWIKPEMSAAYWESIFSVPYPQGGYYVPVGDVEKSIAIREGQKPNRESTETAIRHVKEHFQKTSRQFERETRDGWTERDLKWRGRLKDQVKDLAPVGMGWPGEKTDFSVGGMPNIESPTLRRFQNSQNN